MLRSSNQSLSTPHQCPVNFPWAYNEVSSPKITKLFRHKMVNVKQRLFWEFVQVSVYHGTIVCSCVCVCVIWRHFRFLHIHHLCDSTHDTFFKSLYCVQFHTFCKLCCFVSVEKDDKYQIWIIRVKTAALQPLRKVRQNWRVLEQVGHTVTVRMSAEVFPEVSCRLICAFRPCKIV